MKVLHVLYSKIYTGAEKVAAQIIKAFEGRVDMAYCSLECEEVWEILDGMGIRHYGVEELTPATLSRVIREYRPDVIHAHDMRTSFVAALCCGKIPLISHIHNNAYDARGLSAKSIAYLLAGFRAKHIFWVSNSSYEGYVFHRLFAKKSSMLYNIIDAKRIFAMRDSDENTYDFDMIYLGRLTYQKDPQRLMRLSAALKARKPDIKVAVVGAGELEEETKALCRELDLQDNVHFWLPEQPHQNGGGQQGDDPDLPLGGNAHVRAGSHGAGNAGGQHPVRRDERPDRKRRGRILKRRRRRAGRGYSENRGKS